MLNYVYLTDDFLEMMDQLLWIECLLIGKLQVNEKISELSDEVVMPFELLLLFELSSEDQISQFLG